MRTGEDSIDTVKRAIENVKPPLEVRSRRVGGATYQVPIEVRPRRANTLAIRWLVDFARARREKTMAECLANELMDAANGLGAAMKQRDDIQKMAESQQGVRPLPLVTPRRAVGDETTESNVRNPGQRLRVPSFFDLGAGPSRMH